METKSVDRLKLDATVTTTIEPRGARVSVADMDENIILDMTVSTTTVNTAADTVIEKGHTGDVQILQVAANAKEEKSIKAAGEMVDISVAAATGLQGISVTATTTTKEGETVVIVTISTTAEEKIETKVTITPKHKDEEENLVGSKNCTHMNSPSARRCLHRCDAKIEPLIKRCPGLSCGAHITPYNIKCEQCVKKQRMIDALAADM